MRRPSGQARPASGAEHHDGHQATEIQLLVSELKSSHDEKIAKVLALAKSL